MKENEVNVDENDGERKFHQYVCLLRGSGRSLACCHNTQYEYTIVCVMLDLCVIRTSLSCTRTRIVLKSV